MSVTAFETSVLSSCGRGKVDGLCVGRSNTEEPGLGIVGTVNVDAEESVGAPFSEDIRVSGRYVVDVFSTELQQTGRDRYIS